MDPIKLKPTLEDQALALTLKLKADGMELCQIQRNPNPADTKRPWLAAIHSADAKTHFNGLGITPFAAVANAICFERIYRQGNG